VGEEALAGAVNGAVEMAPVPGPEGDGASGGDAVLFTDGVEAGGSGADAGDESSGGATETGEGEGEGEEEEGAGSGFGV
jgi:hypothetical protein